MKLLSLLSVLCFSNITFSQVIDENYGTDLPKRSVDTPSKVSSSAEFSDPATQRAFDLIVKRLETLRGVDSNRDLFVLGETNGRQTRFYAIPGVHAAAKKILTIARRKDRWRVYGRATDELIARRLMSYAQREYVASKRPKFG